MRFIAAAALIGASIAGAALAQDASQNPLPTFAPEFEQATDGRGAARVIPSRMIERGQSGVAHLCCTPRDDRTLDCRVAFEWPERRRFGETALEFAEGMQITAASLEAYQTQPGRQVHVPVEFRLLPIRREVAEALDGIAERAQNLCGVASAPAEPIVVTVQQVGRVR